MGQKSHTWAPLEASLNNDTMAKPCRKTFNRIEALVDDGGTFIKNTVKYSTYPNVHFQKVSPKLVQKMTSLLHFVWKHCQRGGFRNRTLYWCSYSFIRGEIIYRISEARTLRAPSPILFILANLMYILVS